VLTFTFNDFKSLLQIFTWTGSKFKNFGLGDSLSWKNQYLIETLHNILERYLIVFKSIFFQLKPSQTML
jgi:hypothetical protein